MTISAKPTSLTAVGSIEKATTGIAGLDELTGGGFPKGRTALVCGGAGCGKTLLSMTFLVRGVTEFGESGLFVSFEETDEDLAKNVASLGFDLADLIARRQLHMDHVRVERSEIEETGEYDLEGLFVRLGYAIDMIGAKRVVLDTIEALFGGLSNTAILRSELRRLFAWLKGKGVTSIVTAERGENTLTRHGLEEYVSDCVILLDHRVNDQISTRRLRVVKYRGSPHGTNEYPFLIDDKGISVMPVTSASLNHEVSDERVSSGVPDLDDMLTGGGFFRGSSVLVSGMAGSGKSSIAAQFTNEACRRGERCLYFAFEEAPSQIVRNMRSIGIDLEPWVTQGVLHFSAARPSLFGLEMHLATMHREMERFRPTAVVIDPVSSLLSAGQQQEVQAMAVRLVDFLKAQRITSLFTNLTHGRIEQAVTEINISSLIDTWLLLLNTESNGEYNRQLYLIKSRGMAHSNQVREFHLTDNGIRLREAYVGPGGVLTGSARLSQEARETAAHQERREDIERTMRTLERRRRQFEAQLAVLRTEFETEEEEFHKRLEQAHGREYRLDEEKREMAVNRQAPDRQISLRPKVGE
jgi:circadian clock protein KaiC